MVLLGVGNSYRSTHTYSWLYQCSCHAIVLRKSFFLFSEELPVCTLLRKFSQSILPLDEEDKSRLVIRRKHLFVDAFHKFRGGIDLNKHLSITFVGEAAVDTGGPLREFLCLLNASMFRCNNLFCGSETLRVPTHNTLELEKRSFFFHWSNYSTILHSWWTTS